MLKTVEIVCVAISFGSNHKMTGLMQKTCNRELLGSNPGFFLRLYFLETVFFTFLNLFAYV